MIGRSDPNAQSALRAVARDLAPPLLRRAIQHWRRQGLRFTQHTGTWQQVFRLTGGYDESAILDRVVSATRAVVSGQAKFERDTVLFDQADYPFAVIAMLLREALRGDGNLSVLDFGGSLGSTYRQCKPMLDGIASLRWCVVEQPHFVAAGRAEFETPELSFAASIEEAVSERLPQLALLASVLQYLETPEEILRSIAESGATTLVIDRTPFTNLYEDILCVQHVPASIYSASYPCRLFSREKMSKLIAPDWQVIADFPCAEGTWWTSSGIEFAFRGLALERRDL